MPDTIGSSPATSCVLVVQIRKFGVVAEAAQTLGFKGVWRSRRAVVEGPGTPPKSRGSVTYRSLRCNIARRPQTKAPCGDAAWKLSAPRLDQIPLFRRAAGSLDPARSAGGSVHRSRTPARSARDRKRRKAGLNRHGDRIARRMLAATVAKQREH